jgi:UDP-glucose 4-epimerase
MKILVVGSKGFIGSHVAAVFATTFNYQVHECDVVVDYVNPNYHIIDATNADYHDLFKQFEFDACINCSGAASVPDSIVHPLRDYTLNTVNVFKLLDAIRLFQPGCKFINLSSAAVYGNPCCLPVKENDRLMPISPYGIHKMQAEIIGKEFFDQYAIANCSLRIFSAYGAGLKKQILWDIFQKAKQSDDIELFGSGNESRDFIHVHDVAIAINKCLMKADFRGEAINIGNGKEVPVSEIVHTFLSFFPKPKAVRFTGTVKSGDPKYWKADNSLLLSLGFNTSVDLEKGLQQYFNWASTL